MRIILQSIIVVMVSLLSVNVHCQPNISYGATERLDSELESGSTTVLGENSNYVYVVQNGFDMMTTNAISIVAYDKTYMRKISEKNLANFTGDNLNPDVSGIPDKARLLNSGVFEDRVILFWECDGIVYAQDFDEQLTPSGKATVVLDLSRESNGNTERSENELIWNTTTASIFLIRNDSTDTYLAGGEILASMGENIRVYYSVFDRNYDVLTKGNVEMPFTSRTKLTSGTSFFALGNDNNLYFLTPLETSNEDLRVEVLNYFYGKIDTEDNEVNTFVFESENYRLCSHNLVYIDNKVAIVGLYNDLKQDASLKTRHGIYYVPVSGYKDGDILDPVFSEFDQEQLISKYLPAEKNNQQGKSVWDAMHQPFLFVLDIDIADNKSILFTLSTRPSAFETQNGVLEDWHRNTFFAKFNISGNIEWISADVVLRSLSTSHVLGNTAVFLSITGGDKILQCNLSTGEISAIPSGRRKGLNYLFSEKNMFGALRTRKVKKAYLFSLPLSLVFFPWPVIVFSSEFSTYELFQFGVVKLKSDNE